MLRIGSLIIASLLSCSALAANFDFLPSGQPAEKEFRSLMTSGNYRQALAAWTPAHSGSAFGTSHNGIATYAWLLYQNGMPFTGLELLVQNTQPARLDASLLKMWTTEVKASAYVQRGWVSTLGGWKNVVNNDAVILSLKNKKDIAAAFNRAERLPKDQAGARARVWWQIATLAPLIGELDSSLKALKLLKESGQGVYGQDLISSVQARVLYQKGDMDAALLNFKEIPKSSSLWVESVEERAWAFLRKDDYDHALGEVTTLMSPALSALVGPESYFLSNLMSLKVCDYPRLYKTSEMFKQRHRDRLVDIQDLATKGTNKNAAALLERFERSGVSVESAGPLVTALPRAALRDAKFVRFVESRRQLLTEARRAAELKDSAGALGGAGELERFQTAASRQADRLGQQAWARVRTLAASEVREYKTILNKMHIVEAEVIERMHLDDNLKGQRSKLTKNDVDKGDVLVFPYRSDEVWLDELDNYKARVKDCPTLKGASL